FHGREMSSPAQHFARRGAAGRYVGRLRRNKRVTPPGKYLRRLRTIRPDSISVRSGIRSDFIICPNLPLPPMRKKHGIPVAVLGVLLLFGCDSQLADPSHELMQGPESAVRLPNTPVGGAGLHAIMTG